MNTIIISVSGEELETINVELTAEEVAALYKLRKEHTTKIADLEKKIKDLETSKKYSDDRASESANEINQANVLLTALGVQEKTTEEEAYYRKALTLSTRIALYIAGAKKA